MQLNPSRLWLFRLIKMLFTRYFIMFLRVGSASNFFGRGSSDGALCEHVQVMHQTVDHEHVDGHHKHRANGVEHVGKKVLHSRIEIYGFEDGEIIFGIRRMCLVCLCCRHVSGRR